MITTCLVSVQMVQIASLRILNGVSRDLQYFSSVELSMFNFSQEDKFTVVPFIKPNLICRICGEEGHKARDCPKYDQRSEGYGEKRSLSDVVCFKCGEKGHFADKVFHHHFSSSSSSRLIQSAICHLASALALTAVMEISTLGAVETSGMIVMSTHHLARLALQLL